MATWHWNVMEAQERLPAMLLAAAATFAVFAAINAGFTPHAADLAGRTEAQHGVRQAEPQS